jgi:hypothetical protein
MATFAPASEAQAFVTLKRGLMLPLEALQLAWSLEDRGARLSVDGDAILVDGPPDLLTEADCAAIHRWKRDLILVVTYQPPDQ